MTSSETLAKIRGTLRKYPSVRALKTAADAQREAAKAANAASRVLLPVLPALPAEERRELVFAAVREINRVSLDAAEKMQRTRAESYGEESLGTVRPDFNAERAKNLATHADTVLSELDDPEGTDSWREPLKDLIENNARLAVDDAERELADARYNMGVNAYVVRTTVGANVCEWCAAAAGEYEYGPSMDKELAFGRHTLCKCEIEYHPGTGRVESVRNYRR